MTPDPIGFPIVDRTRGTLSARCDNEAQDMLALNLAWDVINKKKEHPRSPQGLRRNGHEGDERRKGWVSDQAHVSADAHRRCQRRRNHWSQSGLSPTAAATEEPSKQQ